MDDAREQLLDRLRDAGVHAGDLDAAAGDGRLPILAVEHVIGGEPRHSLTHVARQSRLPPDYLRELLRAIGRPNPGHGERLLADEDIAMARIARRMLDAGLPREELLETARVVGQSMSQLGQSILRLAGDALLRPGDSAETVALRYADAVDELVPLVPELLGHAFRLHLRARLQGALISEAEREAGRLSATTDVAVAFADLVDYTRVGQHLDPDDVGRMAGRLARLASRALHPPAELVKTIGDAAMFVAPEAEPLVRTARALRTAVEHDAELPAIRIGIAWGPASTRGGDWFGSTVNLAARVTGVAKPGRIVATEDLAERAGSQSWKRRRKRSLKGIEGRVRTLSLEEGEDG